jgi:hypothetical protein
VPKPGERRCGDRRACCVQREAHREHLPAQSYVPSCASASAFPKKMIEPHIHTEESSWKGKIGEVKIPMYAYLIPSHDLICYERTRT